MWDTVFWNAPLSYLLVFRNPYVIEKIPLGFDGINDSQFIEREVIVAKNAPIIHSFHKYGNLCYSHQIGLCSFSNHRLRASISSSNRTPYYFWCKDKKNIWNHQILFCLRQDFGAWRRFVASLPLRRNKSEKFSHEYLESARNRRNFASWLREIT